MPYGRGTLGSAANEIEASYEDAMEANLFGGEEDDTSAVRAFEMQRQAAKDYAVNKKVQTAAKEKLAQTNTFRQRVPPYAGPRARGYRAQEVRWSDRVDLQDFGAGEDGFLQGGGLAAYRDDDGVLKTARTAKVQVVPAGQADTNEMPVHLKVLSDRSMYDKARRGLRGWAIKIVRYLSRKRGAKQATVKEIGRDVFEGSIDPTRRQLVQSLLLDYLGLSKTGRETLTLVQLFPE